MNRLLIAVALGLAALIGLALIFSAVLVFSPQIALFRNQVAIIPVKGTVEADKPLFSEELSGNEIIEKLQDAGSDPDIAAIVLDIDSGGGSAVASKQIAAAVVEAKGQKPVVSWIGDLGASAAYHIAAASDYIVADEDSLVGSIGAVSVVANIKELLEEFGVKVTVIAAGEHKAMANIFQDLNEEDARILQRIVENAALHFKRDIKIFRANKLDLARFEQIADGRIISGEQAFEAGLIDLVGTRQDALQKAAELAGVEQPAFVDFGKEEISLFDLFSGSGYSFGFGLRKGLAQPPELELRA